MTCGQVFRWEVLPDGRLLGVDGENVFAVKQTENSIELMGDRDAFEKLFRFDEDFEIYEATIRAESPELHPYMDALSGLRLLRPSSAHEEILSFACTPNNNLKRICSMVRHLSSFGDPILEFEDKVLKKFPDLETVASIPEQELRIHGFGYRAKTIPDIAKQILERGGQNWLSDLKMSNYKTAKTELMSLRWIGPKLADCMALFALDFTEAVPVDTHLWQAACRVYFPQYQGLPLTSKRYEELVNLFQNRFGKLAGWAHQYLFYDNVLHWRERQKKIAP